MQDLRFAIRSLRATPIVTGVVILSLALGIGANTAMFSLADAILFRPLPVPAPERLIRIDDVDLTDARDQPQSVVASTIDAVRAAHVVAGVCAFLTPLLTVDIDGRLAPVSAIAASGDCFETLGVRAALGRLLEPHDDLDGAPNVVTISFESWLQDFGGRRDVLERTVGLDGDPFRIVGVVEPRFPGLLLGFPARMYVSTHQLKLPPDLPYAALGQTLFARLRDGDTVARVTARLETEWPVWMALS